MVKLIYSNIAIACISIFFTACGNNNNNNNKANSTTTAPKPAVADTAALQIKTTEAYDSLRNAALNTTPQMLKLDLPATQTTVYGVVMDWETNGGIVTIVAYLNGDAGSYTSANDQVISKGHYESVITSAKKFVKEAQRYLPKTQKTDDYSLPKKNFTTFYLLTNKGTFKGTEDMKKFDNLTSPWQELFDKGNEVSASLRFLKD